MEKNWPNVYKDLGIKPVINAKSWVTIYGGSIMRPEVIKSIQEASSVFVDLEELHNVAGEFVSKVCGSEMSIVTSGCATSIVLMAAASITGKDKDKISKIPHTQGMKNEILIHQGQRNNYDKAFETPGGVLVEYDNNNLEEKINEKTCAIAYVIAPFFDEGLGLSETIEIAHKNKLPLLLDAAAELPPRENLTKFISMGVDAVGFSGGKGIGGPQSTGILTGKKELIDKEISTCLYLGMMTDTGSFQYNGVNGKTHNTLSFLLEKGIDHSKIYNNIISKSDSNIEIIYDNTYSLLKSSKLAIVTSGTATLETALLLSLIHI